MSDDTAAIQAAHDYAYSVGGSVYFPPGQYLTGTINWKYVSFIGSGGTGYPAGTTGTTLLGKPGQDILHVNTTIDGLGVPAWNIENITFEVDDSVDASASFPQRGGVGNAGFAVDHPDGADAANKTFLNQGTFKNVHFLGASMTETGQNNSAGLYKQCGSSVCAWVGYNSFWRLKYGYWEHYPTSNLTSLELASDHTNVDTLYFNGNGSAIRLVNNAAANFDNIVIHGQGVNGFQGIGVTSLTRADNFNLVLGNVEIESATSNWTTGWSLSGEGHEVGRLGVYTQTGSVVINSNYSTYGSVGYISGTNTISITGNKNKILGLRRLDSPSTEPTITNTGVANLVLVDTSAANGNGQIRLYDAANGMMVLSTNKLGNDLIAGSLSIGSQRSSGGGDVYIDGPGGGTVNLRITGQSSILTVDQFSRVGIGRTPAGGGLLIGMGVAFAVKAITYSASMTPNMADGNFQTINVTNTSAMTINNPTNAQAGHTLTLDIKNSSGGAMGAITWGAAFKLDATGFVNPAAGKRKTITFYDDGTNWVQLGPTSADI